MMSAKIIKTQMDKSFKKKGLTFQKSKTYYWEIIPPEPYVLDNEVSDDEFISKIVGITDLNNIHDIILNFVQKPTNSFIVNCKEKDILELFPIKCGKLTIQLEQLDDSAVYAIIVRDESGESIVGRGEIVRLGSLVEISTIKSQIVKHMKTFDDKVDIGNKRMNSLIYKVKVINAQMASANLLGNKNSFLS